MSLDTIPAELRQLRACLLCSLMKNFDQFENDGCENCDAYLSMKGNRDAVYDCTSNSFDGLVALMAPADSWVSRWLRLTRMVKGCYAISVTGSLPPGIIKELKEKGINYKERDHSMSST